MYVNKCTKCSAEFETKNPKRVICPACLYPDRNPVLSSYSQTIPQTDNSEKEETAQTKINPNQEQKKPFHPHHDGSVGSPQGQYQNRGPQGGGFNRPQGGGFNRSPQQGSGFRGPQGGGFNRPQGGGFRKPGPKKALLISKEQVAQIEILYKKMLPLPNYNAHEIIGQEIGLEAHKVFFGINLIRQKLNLPKLPFPKRKLAVSPDQVAAIQTLYEPLLPLPPIGCHKILAKQLKMDEWRVHVGIGVVRRQMELPRWNIDREDAPEEFKKQRQEELKAQEAANNSTDE